MKKHLTHVAAPFAALILLGGVALDSAANAQSSRSRSSASQKKSSSRSTKSSSKSRSTKSKSSSKNRLPAYYAQIGLKDEQRDEIYEIQDSYRKEIAALQKKLDDLREDMTDEIEDVLTRTQKTKLNALKRAAASGSKSSGSKTSSKSGTTRKSSSRSSSKKK